MWVAVFLNLSPEDRGNDLEGGCAGCQGFQHYKMLYSPSSSSFVFSSGSQGEETTWQTTALVEDHYSRPHDFCESAQDPVCVPKFPQESTAFIWRGGFRPCGISIMVTFPDLVHSGVPSCFTFLWGAACPPLGKVLTGLLVTVWLILCSTLQAPTLRWPHPEVIQTFPPQASRTNVTAITRARPTHRTKEDWYTISKVRRDNLTASFECLPFLKGWLLSDEIGPLPFLLLWEPLGCVHLHPKGPDFSRIPERAVLGFGLSCSAETWDQSLMRRGSHREPLKYFQLWLLPTSSWGFILHFLPIG